MRHRLALLAAVPALLLALIAPVLGGSLRNQLSWLETLPGLKGLQAQSETATQLDYSVTLRGSGDDAWQALRRELAERGWRITDNASVNAPKGTMRAMTARKGELDMAASQLSSGAAVILSISVHRASGGAASGASISGTVATSGAPQAGGDIVINDNHENRTYTFNGESIVINGNHNALIAFGGVGSVTVNGSHNVVTIDARVGRVMVNGTHNVIRFSSLRNPSFTGIMDNGSHNSVQRLK